MKKKETRNISSSDIIPKNYSNGLQFLDIMYADPVFIRNTVKPQKPVKRPVKSKVEQPKPVPVVNANTTNQITNNSNKDRLYSLPNAKTKSNPLSIKSIIFYLIFGLILTVILGFVLIAIFGNNSSFDILTIINDIFGFAIFNSIKVYY